MTIDILPTVAHLIGAELPGHKIDGKNIWPLIAGTAGAKSPQEAYYFYYGSQLQAIRKGKWKMHWPHGYRTMAGKPGGRGGIPTSYTNTKTGLVLYNLEEDIGERIDLKDRYPEVVEELSSLGDRMRKDLGDSKVKGSGTRPAGRL